VYTHPARKIPDIAEIRFLAQYAVHQNRLSPSSAGTSWRSLQRPRPHSKGGSRNFGKGGPVRGRSHEPSAEGASTGVVSGGPPPENFEKVDAISCNLAYIFRIRMASDIIQNWAFAEQKTVAATISIQTHTQTPPHFQNSSDFGHYKIQIQFQKYFFSHCIQCKKIKLTLPKIGGPGPLDPSLHSYILLLREGRGGMRRKGVKKREGMRR